MSDIKISNDQNFMVTEKHIYYVSEVASIDINVCHHCAFFIKDGDNNNKKPHLCLAAPCGAMENRKDGRSLLVFKQVGEF